MARRADSPRHVRRGFRLLGRIAAKCVSSVWTFLTTVAFGGAITMIVAWKVFGLYPVAVQSGSMEPTLPVNSLIWVHEVPAKQVKVGDIITFDAPGKKIGRVTHRVARTSTRGSHRYFETKGDANKHLDDWRRFLPPPPAANVTPGAATSTTTRQEWAPGVTFGDRPAVRYVWGVPYLGHIVKLSERPRLRLGILLGILVAIGVSVLGQLWLTPSRRRDGRHASPTPVLLPADAAAAVDIAAERSGDVPTVTFPLVAIAVRSDDLMIRVHGTEPAVVEVHRIPTPPVDWAAATAAGAVVEAFNLVTQSLEDRFPDSRQVVGATPVQLGAVHDLVAPTAESAHADDDDATRFDIADIAAAVRSQANRLTTRARPNQTERSQLLQLASLHAVLSYFDADELSVIEPAADDRRPAFASRVVRHATTTGAAAIALFAFSMVGLTQATLVDTLAMAPVQATGDQLRPITGMSFDSASGAATSNLESTWSAPTGIPPASYDFWRSTSSGVSTAGAPTTNIAASPWDATLAQCSTYYYKSKSRFASMISAESAEFSWLHDGTAPVINSTYVVSTPTGLDAVGDWIGPSADYYLYANVTDNCSPAGSIVVTFDTSSIASVSSTTAPATFGSWTPIGASPTYNFRIGPLTAKAGLVDGAQVPWSVTATVPALYHSHSTTTAGDTPTYDSTAPTVTRTPVLVADKTNYYAPEVGSGAVAQGQAFRLVGGFSDGGSQLSTAAGGSVADITNIATTTSVSLSATGAPFSTENGVDDWTHRTAIGGSAPLAQNPIGNGDKTITIVTQDRVGNATTSVISGRIDSTRPTLSTCADVNGGTGGRLDGGDITRLTFSEAMDPGSIVGTWTDGSASFAGLQFKVWDASFLGLGVLAKDFIHYEGTRLQASGGTADTYDVGSAKWVDTIFASGFALYDNGTIDRVTPQQWDLKYLGASAPSLARPGGFDTPVGETFRLRTSGAGTWDVAGNNVSTASIACPTLPW